MYRRAYWPNEGQKGTPKTYSPTPEEYKKCIDPSHVDREGKTALHLAIIQGGDDEQHLSRVIKAGCDTNATDNHGRCGLHFASEKGFTRCILNLAKHGADPNVLDQYGYSPLMLAARHDYPKAVRALIRSGANPNLENDKKEQALHYAVCKGHLECVEDLITNKAWVNHANVEGATPLILATKFGNIDVIRSLIAANARLDKADSLGRTPLHWAASLGHAEIVQVLLDAGAEIDSFDDQGYSPFVYTIKMNNHRVMRQLLEAGCDRSTVDGLNGTALGLAAIKGHNECVKVLLETGDDPDEFGFFGLTPLMAACFESSQAVVETLISFGADPNVAGRMGVPPIFKCLVHVCCGNAQKRHKILATLIRAGADVNVRANAASYFTTITKGKNCPLSFAMCSGYVSLIRMLLIAGSRVSCQELRDWTAQECDSTYSKESILSPIREWKHSTKSLRHLCRLTIRNSLRITGRGMWKEIDTLPIAPALKEYVDFIDLEQIEPQKAVVADPKGLSMLGVQPMRLCRTMNAALEGTFYLETYSAQNDY